MRIRLLEKGRETVEEKRWS